MNAGESNFNLFQRRLRFVRFFFPDTLGDFLSPQKPTFLKFQVDVAYNSKELICECTSTKQLSVYQIIEVVS